MSNWGDDWSEFMRSRQARLVLYAFCSILCLRYAIGAVIELLTPERYAATIEQIGATMYYVMTVTRALACAWATVSFGKMAYKAFKEGKEDGQ